MNLYVVLGLEAGATLNDIKRAYRRLSRRYHPDINPGDRMAASHFRDITLAYETLSDPTRRHQYDAGGTEPREAPDPAVGFQGFDFSAEVIGGSAPTFGDLFAEVLQRAPGTNRQTLERGADLHHTLSWSLRDAMRGGHCDITTTRLELCRACEGRGRVPIAAHRCQACRGAGRLQSVRGHMVFAKPCPQCQGVGHVSDASCPSCGGRRTELRTGMASITIPAGLADGGRIRVEGQGHAGSAGGPYGDLLITLRVEPDPVFRCEGKDLHVVVPVAIHEAALGTKIDLPAIDGPARVRIPPGTQSGHRFRLRGRGVPSPGHESAGDLVVEVKLVLPSLLDERSKELLREFGAIHAREDVRHDLAAHQPSRERG